MPLARTLWPLPCGLLTAGLVLLAAPVHADEPQRIFGTHECDRGLIGGTGAPHDAAYAKGALASGETARSMADADNSCIGWTLGRVPSHVAVSWTNPKAGARYTVVPIRTYETGDGDRCRDYLALAVIGKRRVETMNTACRDASGAWKLGSPYQDLPATDHPWEGWSGEQPVPPDLEIWLTPGM